MKKLIPFLLTLTTFLANAQYNRIHTVYPHNSLALNRPVSSTLYMTAGSRSMQSLPYFLRTPAVGTLSSLTNLNDPMEQPRPSPTLQSSPIHGAWLRPWTPPSVGNGRFQSVQSFDMQHNVSDSKATYQFTKRKQ